MIDPNNPRRVYAAGAFRSDDAGRTWQTADEGLPQGGIRALALDPRQPARLYAAAPAGTLYRSEDGATSWRPLPGSGAGAGS